jgi:hypothetical protein
MEAVNRIRKAADNAMRERARREAERRVAGVYSRRAGGAKGKGMGNDEFIFRASSSGFGG